MGDDTDAAEAPPPPGTNKVEITVGGHSVSVESAEPLAAVVEHVMRIYQLTRDAAKTLPFGFDATGGQFERAEPYLEPSSMQRWDDEGTQRLTTRDGRTRNLGGRDEVERRLGRVEPEERTTCRLGIADPPGHHRARLGEVSVDRGRAPVRREGH